MQLKNLIEDSSFENDLWSDAVYSETEKLFNNRSLHFATGTTVIASIEIERPILEHIYYGRRYIKTDGDNQPGDSRFEVYGGDGEGLNWVYAWNNGNHPEWEFESTIYKISSIAYDESVSTKIRCFNVETTADTRIDGVMLIDLTACFGMGNEPSKVWCDENISYFDGNIDIIEKPVNSLIFDRTESDIINDTEKGQYCFIDLNRIEIWCQYIADILNKYNYPVSISTKFDWVENDYHYSEDLERIRSNISTLKQAYFSFAEVPENLEYMTWQKANDIEKILKELSALIDNMISQFFHCGEIYSGEV